MGEKTLVALGADEREPRRTSAITAEQLAERWQVQTSHVYRLTRCGVIPAVKLGRYYRYRLDAIERFELDGGGADPGLGPA
jgi:excisionase family DNA binding protein